VNSERAATKPAEGDAGGANLDTSGDGHPTPGPERLSPCADADASPSILASAPFQAVGFTVSSIGYAVGRRFHQILAPLELEPREFALLRAVGAAEGQSQQAIGGRLQIPPSRMVAFVDALEARGLLERRLNPLDRRTRALHLTDAGRELLGRAVVLAAGLERDLCATLSAAEVEQLLELLRRVGMQLGVPARAAHAALVERQPPRQVLAGAPDE
jgi:DNA-binding MarR family transcriptional regulator